jgi:site-specific DNA-methyltransferase (adenine-specific)
MKDIDDKSIDLILCDLPYGITSCEWDIIIPLDKLWKQYNRICKNNAVILLFGSEKFSSYLRLSNKNYKYDFYWYKNRPSGTMLAKKQPLRSIETISVFYKNTPQYYPIMTERTEEELKRFSKKSVYTTCTEIDNRKWNKTPNREDQKLKYPNNVLTFKTVFNRSKEKLNHPNQKPVDLFEYLIKTYTKENDIVLDNCAGSGTTAIACINTKRNYILIEKEQEYFDIINNRIQERVNIKEL